MTNFDCDVCNVPGASNQGADNLSRHSVGECESEKTDLLEREMPKQTSDRSGGPVLVVVEDHIDTEVVKK